MKYTFTLFCLAFLIGGSSIAQIGIGTQTPEAALDVSSTNSGMLIPRVALTSSTDVTTVTIPDGIGVSLSTMVYNTGEANLKPAGFYYWNGSKWLSLDNSEKKIYVGKFIIDSASDKIITGLPFMPKRLEFKAFANVDAYTLNAKNGLGRNEPGKDNYFGFMSGYANFNGGSTLQQVIQGGGSGNSINDHSRYTSDSDCIGIRYADQNGLFLGLTNASLSTFNTDGFTLSINNYTDPVVVIYTAYKY